MMTEHASPVNEARSQPRSGGMISSPSQIIHANVGMIDASLDSLLMARDDQVLTPTNNLNKSGHSGIVRWFVPRPSLA